MAANRIESQLALGGVGMTVDGYLVWGGRWGSGDLRVIITGGLLKELIN